MGNPQRSVTSGLQWGRRNERSETVRVGVAGMYVCMCQLPNIQSDPGESRARRRKAQRKCRAGEPPEGATQVVLDHNTHIILFPQSFTVP